MGKWIYTKENTACQFTKNSGVPIFSKPLSFKQESGHLIKKTVILNV